MNRQFGIKRYHRTSLQVLPLILICLLQINALAQSLSIDETFADEGVYYLEFEEATVVCTDSEIQPDGKILLLGKQIHYLDEVELNVIVRLTPDGQQDSSFGENGIHYFEQDINSENLSVVSMDIADDGSIYIAGSANNIYEKTHLGGVIIKMTPNGSIDSSFATNGWLYPEVTTCQHTTISEIHIFPDYKILIGGTTCYGIDCDTLQFFVARFKANGIIDKSFGTNGLSYTNFGVLECEATRMLIGADGDILLGGYTEDFIALSRYNSNGTADTSFGSNGKMLTDLGASTLTAIGTLSDGTIIVAGNNNIAAYTESGILYPYFGTDGIVSYVFDDYTQFTDIFVQEDDKFILSGYTGDNEFPDVMDMSLTRFSKSGEVDTSFTSEGTFQVDNSNYFSYNRKMHVLLNGDIILSGFEEYNGIRNFLAAIRLNTNLAPNFNTPFHVEHTNVWTTENILYINNTNDYTTRYLIVNEIGQPITEFMADSGLNEFNIDALPAALYILIQYNTSENVTYKFVKPR